MLFRSGHRPGLGCGGDWLWLVVAVVGRDVSRVPGDYGIVITGVDIVDVDDL